MSIEAIPFVNWIFWAALSAGTLLVVGVTELAGRHDARAIGSSWPACWRSSRRSSSRATSPCPRTCRLGHRRPASSADPRLRRRRTGRTSSPRSPAGRAAAWPSARASSASRRWPCWPRQAARGSAPLFAAQLVLAALALGAVNAGMLLGHWYLVTPKLSPAPLRRMMWLLVAALALQAVAFGVALAVVGTERARREPRRG